MSSLSIRYMIIFKDGQHDVPRYIGPFVSETDAEMCIKHELPRPLPGGKVYVREMYGHQHLAVIKELIARERKSAKPRETQPLADFLPAPFGRG